MNKTFIINAALVALILFSTIIIPIDIFNQKVVAADTQRFTERVTPGFAIWEDPNTPNEYAYDYLNLSNVRVREHFHKDRYADGLAFVRIGRTKPTTIPGSGATINPDNLRLVEVRPYGHDAFFPGDVNIQHTDTRVLINIDGISFTKTPHFDVENLHNKGTWGWHGQGNIYLENHHIPLELVWEYTDESTPATVDCPPSGIQTSVTELSGIIYYSCNCDEDGCDVCERKYYETTKINIVGPTPEKVQAGQGTEFKVITSYRNDYPYHQGDPYAAREVKITGVISDNYPSLETKQVDMFTEVSQPQYEWPGNVDWELPFAMFDRDGNWTMTESESEAQNHINASPYNFGGYQRWYFGFDVPDGEEFEFAFQTDSHGYNNITLCDKKSVMVEGTPYDDFVIRTVDPNNPFPTGVGANWQGYEHYITNLKDWYNEPQEKYNAKVNAISSANIFETIKNKLSQMFNL